MSKLNFKSREKWIYFFVLFFMLLQSACSSQNFAIPEQNTTYQQTPKYNTKVDILIMADDSSSMTKYQAGMASQAAEMIAKLNSMGMDYHIAVTTSSIGNRYSGGRFVGSPKFITNSTANVASVLSTRIQVGQGGSDLEQGLISVKNALSTSYLSSEGAGFFRDDALLAIIFLSNENDYSPDSAASYIDFFNSIKRPFPSGARSWVANFVGVTSLNGGCNTVGEFVEVGEKYIAIANASDGIKETICDGNWVRVMSNLQVRINQLVTDFFISRKPKVSSIVVTVNGSVVPQNAANGWTYEEQTIDNQPKYFIRFHGTATPQIHDTIDVKSDPVSAT